MNQINEFLGAYGGLILFTAVFAEQSGLPIPAAPWLLAAGALAASGSMGLFAAIWWAGIGSLAADVLWYCIGHRGKGWVFKLFPHLRTVRYVTNQKTPVRSMARGLRILSVAKFLPFGTIVPLRAGALNVNALKFVMLDAISSVFYASAYVLLGFFFHEQLKEVVALIQRLGLVAFVLVIVALGGYASFGWLKRGHRLQAAGPVEAGTKLEADHV